MNPHHKAHYDGLRAIAAEAQATLTAHAEIYHAKKAAYEALRLKAKTEEPGYWNTTGTYTEQLEDMVDEIQRLSALGFRLAEDQRQKAQAAEDFLRANGLKNLVTRRLI